MAASAAAAAATEDGMEPRALQYEQTLVSRALRSVLPDLCSWLPFSPRRAYPHLAPAL